MYKSKFNFMLLLLFILVIGDYLITYAGMNFYNVITEWNPLMFAFMKLPFNIGFFLRILFSTIIVCVLKYCENKTKPKFYSSAISITLFVQVIPYLGHLYWLLNINR